MNFFGMIYALFGENWDLRWIDLGLRAINHRWLHYILKDECITVIIIYYFSDKDLYYDIETK